MIIWIEMTIWKKNSIVIWDFKHASQLIDNILSKVEPMNHHHNLDLVQKNSLEQP